MTLELNHLKIELFFFNLVRRMSVLPWLVSSTKLVQSKHYFKSRHLSKSPIYSQYISVNKIPIKRTRPLGPLSCLDESFAIVVIPFKGPIAVIRGTKFRVLPTGVEPMTLAVGDSW